MFLKIWVIIGLVDWVVYHIIFSDDGESFQEVLTEIIISLILGPTPIIIAVIEGTKEWLRSLKDV